MIKYELTYSFVPTMCNIGSSCPNGTIPRGMVVLKWKDGVRAGDRHPACALREGWNGRVDPVPLVWLHGSDNQYVDRADLYELLPMGDSSGKYVVLKNGYRELVELPSPGMPRTVPIELQARVAILAEIQNPFLPTNNPKSAEKALARRAAEIYNDARKGAGRVTAPEEESPNAKEPDMAAIAPAAPAKKSFLKKSAPAPAPTKGPAKAPAASGKPAREPKAPKPPKVPTTATEEEIAAAIAGNLKARAQSPGRKQEALTSTDEAGRPKGRPLGVTTGLPICTAWCLAFQENSKTPAQSQIKGLGRQPDEAITRFMRSEFPGRTTPAFDHPAICRNDYNSGRFTRNTLPRIQSDRYDENGAIVNNRGGSKKETKAATKAPAAAPKAAGKAAPAGAPKKVVKA